VLKEEVMFLREDKQLLERQYHDAADMRDKYKSRLERRKEGAKKWKADLEDESAESLRSDYAELKYELESKKDKWKSERNKWADRIERLEVKIEALKEENHKLVVMDTRMRSDFDRRMLNSTSEQRYKDQLKQLEESLRHSEVAFRAADALQKEQEAVTETMRANMRHVEDMGRLKDDKIAALQMASSRAAQQLADASNALDLAAHQKSALEKNLLAANNKFHEQIKVDAQKITQLTNDLAEKNRQFSEQKNNAIHTSAKLQMLENSEKNLLEEIARLTDINNSLAFADEQARLLHGDNQMLAQQLALRSGGPPEVLLGALETLKLQNFNLSGEVVHLRAFAQEYDLERSQLLEEIHVLRHGKGMGPRNGMARGTFANMQLRLAQLGSALGLVGPPGTAHIGPHNGHGNISSPTNSYAKHQLNNNNNHYEQLSPTSPPSSPASHHITAKVPPIDSPNNAEIPKTTTQQEYQEITNAEGTG